MPWIATIKSIADNGVPNDTVNMHVVLTADDGREVRDNNPLNLHVGAFPDLEAIEQLLRARVRDLEAKDQAVEQFAPVKAAIERLVDTVGVTAEGVLSLDKALVLDKDATLTTSVEMIRKVLGVDVALADAVASDVSGVDSIKGG